MKLLLALASLLLLGMAPETPAPPPKVLVAPVDLKARAKFPKAPGQLVDVIAFINQLVNGAMTPMSDQEHYGVEELWVMAPADGKGDCEDFQLTKLFILSRNGWPAVARAKLVGVIVHHNGTTDGHAILALLLPGGEVAYLDNRFPEPMTRKELVAAGYQFFDWRA